MKKHYRFVARGSETSIKQGQKCVVDMAVGMVERNEGFEPYRIDDQPTADVGGVRLGDFHVVADGDGPMKYVILDGEGESHQLSRLPFVTIDFGLREVGHLQKSITVDLPTEMRPGTSGEGSSAVHDGDQWHDVSRACEAVVDALDSAIATQCHALGRVCQPVFVRYGLRLFDGTLAWVSSPVLLMTSPFQPPVAVSSITDVDDAKCRVQMYLSHVRTFQIDYRIEVGLPEWLMPIVSAIDVYMSAPIATYGRGADGCITRYATVVGDAPVEVGSRFAGHYAAQGDDDFKDHCLDDADLQRQSWYLSPNVVFQNQLLGCTDYYRVASLPFIEVNAMSDFAPLPIAGFDLVSLRSLPRLDWNGAQPAYGQCASVTAVGRLFVAPRRKYPAPLPSVRAMMAMSGRPDSSGEVATAMAWMYDEAQGCSVRAVADMPLTVDLSQAFPRYLYVPHPDAYCLGLRQGTRCYSLPLRRHPDGKGAYWFGGFDANCAPTPVADFSGVEGVDSEFVEVRGRIAVSLPGNPFVFPNVAVSTVTDKEIYALSRIKQNLSQGQMGQFLIYAFAAEGVMALAFGTDGHCSAVQIVSTAIVGGEMCETSTGTAFVSGDKLLLLSGTHCEKVALPDYGALLASLPRIKEMMSVMGIEFGIGNIENWEPKLYYNVSANAVCVTIGTVTMCYDMESRGWAVATHDGMSMIVTAPIVPGADMGLTTLCQAALRGRFANGAVALAVYGSNDLRHWHLLVNKRFPAVCGIGGGPFRAYRIVAFCDLTEHDRIDGVSLDITDRFTERL